MKHKNDRTGLIALLTPFLFFCCQLVNAQEYNQDIRHLIHSLPIFDHYGIVAELTVDELNRYQLDAETGTITAKIWYEAVIRIPNWAKHARYSYYSEFPIFDNLKYQGSWLKTKVLTGSKIPGSPLENFAVHVTSDYAHKEFSTSKASVPKWPEALKNKSKILTAILLGTNPVMLREFDTDSYFRWSWVDDIFGSQFENQTIHLMPSTNPRVLKINPGNHYRMAIIFDENDQPEAVLLDDAQGAFIRNSYSALTPVFYAANTFELLHHAEHSYDFAKATLFTKGLTKKERLLNLGFAAHNTFEFCEHAAHTQVPQKIWHYAMGINQTESIEEEFEPDYILGAMDVVNLASTLSELIYQLPLGTTTLIRNSLSVGIGVANLMVSANQKSLIEKYDTRIDEMIARYFSNHSQLYNQYRKRL